jgi:hypothetical protein
LLSRRRVACWEENDQVPMAGSAAREPFSCPDWSSYETLFLSVSQQTFRSSRAEL